MSDIPVLISDLAVILIAAGIVTLLFKWLKQPVVLGYIVAGLLAGPAVEWLPSISDPANIRIWADIGVIFLLFAMGLEFSFKKLMHIGGTAGIAALTIVVGMMTAGYCVGRLLGWSQMNCLFLGGMLSMSSTAIVYKAFDDMGLREQRFAGVVLGILVVEDLVGVVLMVLLSTFAVSREVEGMEMANSILKLGAFLLFWSVMGIFLIPTFLQKTRRLLNDETLLIVALGLCLGMVLLATRSGFSSALGAFVMGSLLAETVEAESIERIVKPVKNLFGAIFFVSVGMMIVPSMLVQYIGPILLLTLLVIVGQVVFSSFGILLSGQPLKIAVQSGFSLTQVGEFAFIIAALGVSLRVTDDFLYPIVVAVSVITTFFTPYMIRMAEPAYNFLDRRMPPSWKAFLDRYASGSNTIRHKSAWNRLLKSLVRIVATYTVLCTFFILIFFQYVAPWIREYIPGVRGSLICLVIVLGVISPFLRAIIMKKNHSAEFQQLWKDNKYNRGPLVSLIAVRILLCIGIVMGIVAELFNVALGLGLAIAVIIIGMIVVSKRLKKHSILLERRFFRNFSERELEQERKSPIKRNFVNNLLLRDLHLADFDVVQGSMSVGRTLKELNYRQKYGVSVVSIIRGEYRINIPGGEERLYPFDKVIAVGTDKELEDFRQDITARNQRNKKEMAAKYQGDVSMEQFAIEAGSKLIGLTIRQSGIRDRATCLVIGIERGDRSLMNPTPDTVFEEGDIVWIVGERSKLFRLAEGKRI